MPKLDNLKVISCLSKKAKFGIDDPDVMNLYKVEINTDDEGKVKDVEDIERKRDELKAKFMNPADVLISDYFPDKPPVEQVHIIIAVLLPKRLPMVYLLNKEFTVETMIHIFIITFVNMLSYSPLELKRKRPITNEEIKMKTCFSTGENKRKWTANSTIRNQIRNYVYFVDLEETNAPLLDMILRREFVALLASS
ncbi:hypothetical protein RhiirA5_414834 [Rhizophagus irregularis]|uniref:Crinkler effector protein N-terminal domain-containing protein n=1 Tax=Rhizophagus irregularis TaxID=588596 RepID=A0A2I1ELS6_9GLOM|nr:hypothetical protein RhiirA5_414834 [Rhizophagus irregularis]PKY23065.1 hypothetical protein RhiirB3_437171 [Rhizophagus irregularis]